MASESAIEILNLNVPSKTREEGELSSSGDEVPTCTRGKSSPAVVSNPVSQALNGTVGVQGGSNGIHVQKTIQSTSQKSFNRNQLPPKSSMWPAHAGSDKSLVISFSDDDSGSDSEDGKQDKAVESKGNASRLDNNQKPPALSSAKSYKLVNGARSVNKSLPKRSPLNHTSFSSATKTHGSNSKVAGPFSMGQGSRSRNFYILNKNLARPERKNEQGVVSNNNKLQDLRQQIAIRESELKLKAAQQNKEPPSSLGRDHNAIKLKSVTARKYAYSENVQLESKEPDKKRLKFGRSYATPQAIENLPEVPATKSLLPAKESALENCNLQERNKVDHGVKETQLCTGEPLVIKSQGHDKCLDISSQTMQSRPRSGTYVNNNCNQMDKHNRLVDPCVSFNQSGLPANLISNSVPTNTELLNNFNDHANDSEHSNIDLNSFFEMEEFIDKELEEAQEHRHRCEVEERNALKAYLKAQRALIEANGRCTNLLRKREMYSAKLKSLILNNSGFSWSSGQHAHLDSGLDYLPRHGYVIPTSSCQGLTEFNDVNQPGFDTTNQDVNNGPSNTMYHRMNGVNLGSEPCSEPDASTSEPLPRMANNTVDRVNSPSDELDASANDNEEMSPSHVSTDHGIVNQRKQYSNASLMDRDTSSNARLSTEDPQDSLLLEAALRSELFARLGTRASESHSTCNNLGLAAKRGFENEHRQIQDGVVPLSRAEDNTFRGNESHESNIYLDPAEIQCQQNTCQTSLISNCSAASRDQGSLALQLHRSMGAMKISPLIFRSAFGHLKQMSKLNSKHLLSKNQWFPVNVGKNENNSCHGSIRTESSSMLAMTMPTAGWNLASEESSYSYSPAVDPFWPLCMYELRGKCNNDECPWQHIKDYNDESYQNQHSDNDDADCLGGLTLHQQSATKVSKSHKAAILPTYLVGLDVLRAEQLVYKSVLTCRNTQYWQKCFSITLATSNLLENGLQEDGRFLHGGERIEVHGTWNKQFSYLQWKRANKSEQALADNEQAVERALLVLNQEINKLEGVRKALSVLSRVLETDPTSVVIWIVYLLIYYGNLKPTGKDDMYLYAVKHNEGSYVLWLMYINSRTQLDERLVAYDAALLALCQNTSTAVKDGIHTSACILDLFLQMMDCLCMSGNVEKAIQRSYGVFPDATKSHELHHLSFSDILNCLTFSDKCIFWICCIYLVMYRKLPDAIIQKFECEKDLDIEWPVIHLSEGDKQMAVKLVETAVESVDSCIYNESAKSEVNLKSAQLFALNHIRCMVALDNLECLGSLLDKYVKLYPGSIELVLESVHIKKHENGIDNFMGFKEAISRWPKEIPGIQCIWNQYIENAVRHGRIDLAKEITVRWFQSAWQVQESHNGEMDTTYGDHSCSSLGPDSKSFPDTSSSGLSQMDVMLGFLNLSLYNFFQNDETEACIAIDKARKAANFGGLDNRMRKHAMFFLSDASCLKDNGPNGGIKKILEMYNDRAFQDFIAPKLITRNLFDDVKKPRVQQHISNLLSPVSIDCSVLNMILQSWYGSSLLPQTFSDPKELVDFVEAILEVVPSNFQLAISVCKLLSKGFNPASADQTSASLLFWACSAMVNAILHAIPVPPEYVWVEAGLLLDNVMGIEAISERFYGRALSVYPFSVRLWKSFCNLHKDIGDAGDIIEAAQKRGISIKLD
ncbi:uncharacterized protein LOC129305366 isoform X2 [Prosopis cineraria]|uniref:uncharacterized protein LOC129305366 isoform X2 n=1 Tax=Prosopis cineraria TaxID=364024 RepID=UPI00240F0D59|nr:uncharacterized protein LOC129305366 isoform X2 [Prosopis cineraria]